MMPVSVRWRNWLSCGKEGNRGKKYLSGDMMVQSLEEVVEFFVPARGKVDRIYAHWTGAPSSMTDFMEYHVVIDRAGGFHVMHSDFTRVLSHTWRRNGRSVGVAMACACGACCWYDGPAGVYPGEAPTKKQIESLAMFCGCGLYQLDLPGETLFTHAEIAKIDGYGIGSGDPDMRWDLLYLPDYENNGVLVPGGELLRGKAEFYRGKMSCGVF